MVEVVTGAEEEEEVATAEVATVEAKEVAATAEVATEEVTAEAARVGAARVEVAMAVEMEEGATEVVMVVEAMEVG